MSKKTILITGGSRGIGRAAAVRLAREHRVAVTGRDAAALEETRRLVSAAGGEVLTLRADATREDEVHASVESTAQELGPVQVLVNNAGMGIFKRVDEFSLEEFEQIFRVNLYSAFLYTKSVTPGMIAARAGQIINIASVAGLNGFKTGTAYAASKFALVGFNESLREDLKQYGIAVTAVCPGGVATEFGGADVEERHRQSEYLLEADDVARTIEYLVSESETANAKLIELKPRRRAQFRG